MKTAQKTAYELLAEHNGVQAERNRLAAQIARSPEHVAMQLRMEMAKTDARLGRLLDLHTAAVEREAGAAIEVAEHELEGMQAEVAEALTLIGADPFSTGERATESRFVLARRDDLILKIASSRAAATLARERGYARSH